MPQLHGGAASSVREHRGDRRAARRRVRRVHRHASRKPLAASDEDRPRRRVHLRPVRQRRAHGHAVSPQAEDVLITGAGPIGLMAAIVARHNGARFVVMTDVSDYRLELARKVGVTSAADVRQTKLAEVQHELGMKEGFDVGFEMSGQPSAMRDMIDNMAHGGRIAVLGLPDHEFAVDWSQVVFKMLTVKGVYGRQIFETWYQMSVFVQSGLDISPVITHRFPYQQFKEAFAVGHSGQCGKIVLDWTS